jgi:hypothetical protein
MAYCRAVTLTIIPHDKCLHESRQFSVRAKYVQQLSFSKSKRSVDSPQPNVSKR